jgi:hypothetical protein
MGMLGFIGLVKALRYAKAINTLLARKIMHIGECCSGTRCCHVSSELMLLQAVDSSLCSPGRCFLMCAAALAVPRSYTVVPADARGKLRGCCCSCFYYCLLWARGCR